MGQGTRSNTISCSDRARHVHAVAHGVRAEQAGFFLRPEYVDQTEAVGRVDRRVVRKAAGPAPSRTGAI